MEASQQRPGCCLACTKVWPDRDAHLVSIPGAAPGHHEPFQVLEVLPRSLELLSPDAAWADLPEVRL